MKLTLRGIEIFIAVVEEASMSGGARRLGASVSAVSQQIANLEDALGARLIDRAARPFALTPAGHLFHRRALAILGEASLAEAELAERRITRFRRLRFAVVDEFEGRLLPRLLADLAAENPDCTFSIRSGLSHENVAALESRSVDLVISADVERLPDEVERHPILRDPFILAAPPGVDPETAPMIAYAPNQMLGRLIDAHLRRLRKAPPRRFEIATNAGVLATTAALGGWCVTTALAFRASAADGLEPRPLPFPDFSRRLAVFARRDVLGSLPERAAEVLRRELSAEVEATCRDLPWLGAQFRVISAASAMDEIEVSEI
ncbi:MAG: LysR family transcriptional regulator [Pseudomonadota bacterium]